jgi:hypothetical protein
MRHHVRDFISHGTHHELGKLSDRFAYTDIA